MASPSLPFAPKASRSFSWRSIENYGRRESHSMDGMDNVRLTNEDSFDISNQNWTMEVRGNDGKPS